MTQNQVDGPERHPRCLGVTYAKKDDRCLLMRSAPRITITFFGMENGTFTGKKFAE